MLAVCLCGMAFLPQPGNALQAPSAAGDAARDAAAGATLGLTADDQAVLRRVAEHARGLKFVTTPPFEIIAASNVMSTVTNGVSAEEQRQEDEQERKSALLGVWMGVLPENVDLKKVNRILMESEVAGFYSTDTKSIFVNRDAMTNDTGAIEPEIALVHELIHALDDQHGYMDTNDYEESDITLSRECLTEGSATLGMIDALTPLMIREMSYPLGQGREFLLVNSLFSSAVFKAVLAHEFGGLEAGGLDKTNGIPDVVMRRVIEPYVAGFLFCQNVAGEWGLDGLDRALRKPPQTMRQVLDPGAYWAWREWPERIAMPTNDLSAGPGWSCLMTDTLGESEAAICFDYLLGDGAGRPATQGWKGDKLAFYGNEAGHRMLVWASAWDSVWAARRFERAYRAILVRRFQATFTAASGGLAWNGNTSRAGRILRDGRHLILIETDDAAALKQADRIAATVHFAPPPEEAIRRAQNHVLLEHNPLLAWQRDDDWRTWRLLMGAYRCDECEIGVRHSVLDGWLLQRRRSLNFSDDSLLAGWLYQRTAERRRDAVRLRVLPGGLALNYSRSAYPAVGKQWYSHGSLLWGLLGSWGNANSGEATVTVLPFGWLCGAHSEKWEGQTVRRRLDLLPWGLLWHDNRGTDQSALWHDNALAGLLWSHRSDRDSRHTTVLPFGFLYRMDQDKQSVVARVLGIPIYRRQIR